ncbi:MAG: hypothetical protein Q9209_001700 [Squamulea sp. 1 TL-2023]
MSRAMPPPASMNLLDLPTEILLRIIEHDVRHEDLENLALCSRSVLELAKRARAKHLKRKKNYSKIVVGDICVYKRLEERQALADEVHPAVVLQDIVTDTHNMGDYCKTLMLGNIEGCQEDKCSYTAWRAAMEVLASLNPQQKHNFDTTFCGRSGDRVVWFRRHLQAFYEVTCSTIFTSLYKTEVLKIVNSSNRLYVSDSTLATMHETYHDLKEVRAFGDRHLNGECINTLCMFASSIPSVRTISGFHIAEHVGNHLHPGSLILPLPCPNLEEIHFECSSIESSTFERLLSSVKDLRVFYNENNRDRTRDSEYRSNRTVAALRKYASHSLESFTFFDLSSRYFVETDLADDSKSLREFRVLKHAALEFSHFIKVDKDGREEKFRLVDLLPPTLETLELYHLRPRVGTACIFAGLREQRKKRLPNLSSIFVQKDIVVSGQIKRDCKKAGIKLAFVDAPKTKWSHL